MKEKAIVCWSGGKDSALAVHRLQQAGDYEIAALLTTVTEEYDRISMHGVRVGLLERQAEAMGLGLEKVFISKDTTERQYEAKMRQVLEKYIGLGVSAVVFGDIFLEDVRKYREDNLAKMGLKAVFPLWGRDTAELSRSFIELGFKAVTTCVDSHFLDKEFVGRVYDEGFLAELPGGVDPCGERGEFHSFVYDGPIFRDAIDHRCGEIVMRESRFYYCDVTGIGYNLLKPTSRSV